METEDEIRGKAYVHWYSWHTVYAGLVDQAYLDQLTPEKMEEKAFQWRDNILVAKDGDRVVGFIGYGKSGEAGPEAGEIIALYVLSEYFGTGLGLSFCKEAMEAMGGVIRCNSVFGEFAEFLLEFPNIKASKIDKFKALLDSKSR